MKTKQGDGRQVALVLSGGGARGMAHIGVIEEMLKQGYTISSIAGTSIGSLIAGVYVSGKLEEFKESLLSKMGMKKSKARVDGKVVDLKL